MCGILGYFNNEINNSFDLSILKHRGPDDSGFYEDKKTGTLLGHTRLSILDLSSAGHQPMLFDRFAITYNGEIYNFNEIKKELLNIGYSFSTNTDTEVILKSYIQWGADCVCKFRGMFAFAIYDKKQGMSQLPLDEKPIPHTPYLFIARDRFGIKPLLYTINNNTFYFSSELKTFTENSWVNPSILLKSVVDVMVYGSIRQPHTILEGVNHLMPGHYGFVDKKGEIELKEYYNIDYKINSEQTQVKHKDRTQIIKDVLEEATKYHLVSDTPVGAFLSGGLDSAAAVALMSKLTSKQIETFSIGFLDKTNVNDETQAAMLTAKYIGTNHHSVLLNDKDIPNIFDLFIRSIDQPTIDGINTYIVSKYARDYVKVVISGLGGDEIFAGYPHFNSINKIHGRTFWGIDKIALFLDRLRPNKITNKFKYSGLSIDRSLLEMRSIISPRVLEKVTTANSYFEYNKDIYDGMNISNIQKISSHEIQNYLLNTLLRDSDITSMAHSLELRPVLLDHILVETALNLTDDFKINQGIFKYCLIDATKDIVPEHCWKNRKAGFEMPFNRWMKGCLNSRVKDAFHSNFAKQLLTTSYLKKIQTDFKNGKITRVHWMFFVLFSWLKSNSEINIKL